MIVVTGGAGFIGSCFIKHLNNKGIKDILVVDSFGKSSKWKNLVGKKYIDFMNKDDFRNLLTDDGSFPFEVEAIIHLGACSSTTEDDVDYLFDNNYQYSKDLALFALNNKIKFIYASSAATYGFGESGYSDDEFENLKPLNAYGFSKYMFDEWVINSGLDKTFVGLKFFNVFGPNEYHKDNMASMVYKSFQQIKSTGKVNLFKSNSLEYKDGEQKRDFVYVKDCCEIIYQFIQKPKKNGIYNVGNGNSSTWRVLIDNVFKAMNLESKIEFVEMPDQIKFQYQNFTEANITKLTKAIGKHKFMTLEESVNDYVKNYLNSSYQYY
ncbi:MAG: ADP-glyceromanno-heptose 6-epimerase [Candidatus Kapabacteria bacterium]|nr:ADP-glyceromanno-heptose 6-epimerase [Candidatus Kapabacteria bacterium]